MLRVSHGATGDGRGGKEQPPKERQGCLAGVSWGRTKDVRHCHIIVERYHGYIEGNTAWIL